MKKILFLLSVWMVAGISFAQIPANYYDAAEGLTGYALKSQLHTIITNGHVDHGYDALYNGYINTDSDYYYENDGTVLDIYSEKPSGADAYNYQHGSNTCGTYNSESDCYNREHIVPQSVFGSASPMKSDIHFVIPTDGYVNNRRGSYAFGEVSNPTWTSTNGSKVGPNTFESYNGTVFEPIDEFKGDIARMLFYFATRYETQVDSWSHDMFNGTEDQVFADWFLDLLLQWHYNDPVSQREIDRNTACYNYQGNANPFIDHPEWVSVIWDPVPDNEPPTAPQNLLALSVEANRVVLSWDAATDNTGVTGYDVYKNDAYEKSVPATTTSVTGLSPETDYEFYVIAKDASGNASPSSNILAITTASTPGYIVFEDFNDCATISDNFVTYSEASDKDWTCLSQYGEDNTGCMQMNGYNEDVPSKDWLITANSIDFSQYSGEKLSVFLVHTYGTMSLDLLYSTDYDGAGNPANFNWQPVPNVTIDTHDGSSNEYFQNISEADISAISGVAYIAFRYYSNGSPTRWNVDNFVISADNTASVPENKLAGVRLYPNPVSGFIHISSQRPVQRICVYNALGQRVLTARNSERIDVSALPGGVYFCNISTENDLVEQRRFIKY